MSRSALSLALLCALVAIGSPAQDFDVFDTVEGATANVGGAYNAPLPPPAPRAAYDPVTGGPAPMGPGFTPRPAVSPAFAPAGPIPAAPAIVEPRITVIRGQTIRDSVSGSLLEVPEMAEDLQSNSALYSNDGMTRGDLFADDDIWTNVETLDKMFIGPETHTYILYYINMIRLLHEMDPLAFRAVSVASPDPVSPLPQLEDYEEHQDTRLQEWNAGFLRDFRQPDPIIGEISERGEFYPIYVPPPPFYRPVAPDSLETTPPVDFMEQVWVAYQGGTPNPQAITSVRPAQGGAYGYPGAYPGVGGEAGGQPFGGSAAREWQGRSSYIDTPAAPPPAFDEMR